MGQLQAVIPDNLFYDSGPPELLSRVSSHKSLRDSEDF